MAPYVEREEITLGYFVDNIIYLKAAYLLRVRKYQPRFKGKINPTNSIALTFRPNIQELTDDTLALAILENDSFESEEKSQVFEWMLEQKIYSTNPLTVARICNALIMGDCSIGCLLRNLPLPDTEDFPDPNPDVASNGDVQQNILHAVVYNGGILQIWKSLQKIFSTEELIQMLLQR